LTCISVVDAGRDDGFALPVAISVFIHVLPALQMVIVLCVNAGRYGIYPEQSYRMVIKTKHRPWQPLHHLLSITGNGNISDIPEILGITYVISQR
jgi:hypothetical protein